ncbi:MAG: DNA-packaging protein [Rhodobiaceae bacterium]|nr:DNA-packaging protein [Rhodobiaceae bacterium]
MRTRSLDKVLGREYATIYLNEASEITYQAFNTVKTRLAQKTRVTAGAGNFLPLKCYVDLNPTTQSHWTYRVFVEGVEPEGRAAAAAGDYVFGMAGPLDNADNLPAAYIESLKHLPRSQRIRFFEGAYAGDSADSLWTRQSIGRLYLENESDLPAFRRVVVAIDPAVSSHAGSNETGIVAAATDGQGQGHVLADGSGVMKPDEWARKAVTLFHYYRADCIVAEANQGGDMVESTLRAIAPDIPVKLVRASRGKYVRAEPVAALYARGRVRHVGEFRELEDQMCSFTPDFDRKAEGFSPDRVDALVWAMSELFPGLVSDRQRGEHRKQSLAMGDYDPFGG